MKDTEESENQKHLRVVNEIAAIFKREFEESDDIYFVVRTLRNVFLFDEEDRHTEHLFGNALDRYAKVNKEYIKNHFNLRDK